MPIHVAIVDDNTSYREGLRYLLEFSADFLCVGSYYSGQQLLSQLPQTPPEVILMDIEMPQLDGIACTSRLKALASYQRTDIIVLSVLENAEKVLSAILAGASGYLLKSEPPEQILSAIRQVHAGGSPMSAEIARQVLELVRQGRPRERESVGLSVRELSVLGGLVEGLSYRMIGERESMATDTVRGHIKRIYEKLQVHSRSQAVAKALKNNVL